jgi:hypothetical protein
MTQGVPSELVTAIRRLVEEIAPHDPGLAARAFNGLVTVYGRIACGAAVHRIIDGSPSPAWLPV